MVISLYDFIEAYYEEITNIKGEYQQLNFSKPNISDCSEIIDTSKKHPFIELKNSSAYKKVANTIMHIFYASPLDKEISSKSPINQYLKIKEFVFLKDTNNHQNAIIAIAYGLYIINKEDEFSELINISCHSFVELVQTLCAINLKTADMLILSTKLLALLLEQITYKTNNKLEYESCPILVS